MSHTPSPEQHPVRTRGLFTPQYEAELQKLFGGLQILENSFARYRKTPVRRKAERLKQGTSLFRIYWQNALKLLLPCVREQQINAQRLFMRYGLLHLDDLSPEDLEALDSVPLQANGPSHVYYIDEWFHHLGQGDVAPLAQDSGTENREPVANSLVTREAALLEVVVANLCRDSKSSVMPFLQKDDLAGPVRQQFASREAVQKVIHLVRNIDPEVFSRKLLKEQVDIEPNVILVPCYASFGSCWQAFDRLQRTSSSGRIIVPLYAPKTQWAVLVALADYRWQTAKLAAGGYWLEKGLTGGFYDLYRKHKLPGGNEQQAFILAYCQWIMEESRGRIKLRPELRRFFWREIPFDKKRSDVLVQYFAQFRDIVA